MTKSTSLVRMEVLGFLAAFAFLTFLLATTESVDFQSPLQAFPQTSPLFAADYTAPLANEGLEEVGPVGPGKGSQWRRRHSALRWKITQGIAPQLVARKARSRSGKRETVDIEVVEAQAEAEKTM